MWRPKTLKNIIDAAMVSTPEEVTDESHNVHMTSTAVKNPSASKSLCLFTNILNVKKKTAKLRFVVQNPNAEPWNWVIACGPIKQNEKGIQKFMNQHPEMC